MVLVLFGDGNGVAAEEGHVLLPFVVEEGQLFKDVLAELDLGSRDIFGRLNIHL